MKKDALTELWIQFGPFRTQKGSNLTLSLSGWKIQGRKSRYNPHLLTLPRHWLLLPFTHTLSGCHGQQPFDTGKLQPHFPNLFTALITWDHSLCQRPATSAQVRCTSPDQGQTWENRHHVPQFSSLDSFQGDDSGTSLNRGFCR